MEDWGCSSFDGELAEHGGSPGSIPEPNIGSMVVHTYSPCNLEMEVKGPEAQGQPWLNMEFEVGMGYTEKKKKVWSLEDVKPLYGI